MKIAVVTSSIGTNKLLPVNKFENVDYHAFVDDENQYNNGWNIHSTIDFTLDYKYKNRRNAKIYKILPFVFLPNYDYYIWIDSTHMVGMNPVKVIDDYLQDSDVAVFNHPLRNCVYIEGQFIKEVGYLDHSNLIDDQLAFYHDTGYPKNNGLYELPSRMQRNNKITQQMGWMWWEQICMFSSRDQLSFPYVC